MSREKIEKNCNECLHFEACCKWTDFPKQIGFPTCRKFAPISGNRKQSEWISVEERLPESECPVLIFTIKNRYYVGYYYKALIDQTFTGFYADAVRRDVTYWMPLPEPPKKGGGEG